MTPSTGPADPLVRTTLPTPVGALTLIASDRGLRAVLWPDDRPGRVPLPGAIDDAPAHPLLADASEQLTAWFAGHRRHFDLALDPVGTPFQQSVWAALTAVDFGCTVTYAEVADRIGDRSKARAVGAAVGRNPLSVVVGCHRVVGAAGALTGFAGGLEAKRWLLDHEAGTSPLALD